MSERVVFGTSYLYDYPNLVPVLRKVLPEVCRSWGFRETVIDVADTEEKTRAFFGVMHGGYQGEEAHQMEWFIEETLLPALPEKHGAFSITVTPEWEEYTTVFLIKDRMMTMLRAQPFTYPEGPGPTIIDGRTK